MIKLMITKSKTWGLGTLALALAVVSLEAVTPSLAVADGLSPRFFEAGAKTKTNGVWIGMQVQTVTKELVSRFDLQTGEGVYVNSVVDASPAEESGVRPGDVVVEYDYRKVTSSRELAEFVSEGEPGDEVILFVDRAGKKKRLVAQLNTRPTEEPANIRSLTPPGEERDNSSRYRVNTAPYIGVALQSISGQLADYFAVPGGAGALIVETLAGSPAEEAGLKAGDVVIAADGSVIEVTEDMQRVVRERQSGDKIEITVIRNRRKTVLSVIVAEREAKLGKLGKLGRLGQPGLFGFMDPLAEGGHPFGMPLRDFGIERSGRTLDQLELPDVIFSRTKGKNVRIDSLEKQIKELKEQIETLMENNAVK
jgi:membrane-associated protease RseP (regulator of RpoE activity)